MPAITTSDVRTMLAAQLHYADVASLESWWTPITTQCTAEAEAWLRFTLEGFGPQAIAKWPMFGHYQLKLALYWCGVYGGAELTVEDKVLLEKMDCRAEVMAIESLGDDPDSTDDDSVIGGRMCRSDDLFANPSVDSHGRLPPDVFRCGREVPSWSR